MLPFPHPGVSGQISGLSEAFPEVIIEKILWKQFADEKPVIPGVYLVAWESVNMDQTCGVEQSTWSMGLNQLGFNNLTQDNVYDERGVMTYGRTIIAWSEMPTYWR